MDKFPKETIAQVIKDVTKAENADEVKEIVRGYGEELTDEQAELLLRLYSEDIVATNSNLTNMSGENLDKISGGILVIDEPLEIEPASAQHDYC